jgi:uncharacterized protein DUF2846
VGGGIRARGRRRLRAFLFFVGRAGGWPEDTAGKANLYVFRDESMGSAVKMSVLLDDKLLGDTAAKTFLLEAVDPGKHALVSKTENDARLDFTAEPGKNVYVWQEVKMGVLSARSALHLVEEAEAKPRINECNLSVREAAPAAAPAAPTKDVPRS